VLGADVVSTLFDEMYATQGYQLSVDLERRVVVKPSGEEIPFEVDEFRRHCLLNGLDDIGLTLESEQAIRAYEQGWQQSSPWLFGVIK
jgi:3-isopropylmalate/(R)-2-methylmalate dehydratase small subunit